MPVPPRIAERSPSSVQQNHSSQRNDAKGADVKGADAKSPLKNSPNKGYDQQVAELKPSNRLGFEEQRKALVPKPAQRKHVKGADAKSPLKNSPNKGYDQQVAKLGPPKQIVFEDQQKALVPKPAQRKDAKEADAKEADAKSPLKNSLNQGQVAKPNPSNQPGFEEQRKAVKPKPEKKSREWDSARRLKGLLVGEEPSLNAVKRALQAVSLPMVEGHYRQLTHRELTDDIKKALDEGRGRDRVLASLKAGYWLTQGAVLEARMEVGDRAAKLRELLGKHKKIKTLKVAQRVLDLSAGTGEVAAVFQRQYGECLNDAVFGRIDRNSDLYEYVLDAWFDLHPRLRRMQLASGKATDGVGHAGAFVKLVEETEPESLVELHDAVRAMSDRMKNKHAVRQGLIKRRGKHAGRLVDAMLDSAQCSPKDGEAASKVEWKKLDKDFQKAKEVEAKALVRYVCSENYELLRTDRTGKALTNHAATVHLRAWAERQLGNVRGYLGTEDSSLDAYLKSQKVSPARRGFVLGIIRGESLENLSSDDRKGASKELLDKVWELRLLFERKVALGRGSAKSWDRVFQLIAEVGDKGRLLFLKQWDGRIALEDKASDRSRALRALVDDVMLKVVDSKLRRRFLAALERGAADERGLNGSAHAQITNVVFGAKHDIFNRGTHSWDKQLLRKLVHRLTPDEVSRVSADKRLLTGLASRYPVVLQELKALARPKGPSGQNKKLVPVGTADEIAANPSYWSALIRYELAKKHSRQRFDRVASLVAQFLKTTTELDEKAAFLCRRDFFEGIALPLADRQSTASKHDAKRWKALTTSILEGKPLRLSVRLNAHFTLRHAIRHKLLSKDIALRALEDAEPAELLRDWSNYGSFIGLARALEAAKQDRNRDDIKALQTKVRRFIPDMGPQLYGLLKVELSATDFQEVYRTVVERIAVSIDSDEEYRAAMATAGMPVDAMTSASVRSAGVLHDEERDSSGLQYERGLGYQHAGLRREAIGDLVGALRMPSETDNDKKQRKKRIDAALELCESRQAEFRAFKERADAVLVRSTTLTLGIATSLATFGMSSGLMASNPALWRVWGKWLFSTGISAVRGAVLHKAEALIKGGKNVDDGEIIYQIAKDTLLAFATQKAGDFSGSIEDSSFAAWRVPNGDPHVVSSMSKNLMDVSAVEVALRTAVDKALENRTDVDADALKFAPTIKDYVSDWLQDTILKTTHDSLVKLDDTKHFAMVGEEDNNPVYFDRPDWFKTTGGDKAWVTFMENMTAQNYAVDEQDGFFADLVSYVFDRVRNAQSVCMEVDVESVEDKEAQEPKAIKPNDVADLLDIGDAEPDLAADYLEDIKEETTFFGEIEGAVLAKQLGIAVEVFTMTRSSGKVPGEYTFDGQRFVESQRLKTGRDGSCLIDALYLVSSGNLPALETRRDARWQVSRALGTTPKGKAALDEQLIAMRIAAENGERPPGLGPRVRRYFAAVARQQDQKAKAKSNVSSKPASGSPKAKAKKAGQSSPSKPAESKASKPRNEQNDDLVGAMARSLSWGEGEITGTILLRNSHYVVLERVEDGQSPRSPSFNDDEWKPTDAELPKAVIECATKLKPNGHVSVFINNEPYWLVVERDRARVVPRRPGG